jgi:hypothetical protein
VTILRASNQWPKCRGINFSHGINFPRPLYLERCEELKLDTLEKRREDQDMALAHKMISEERFQNNMVLRTVGENTRAATRMASEPKNLITQYARTELRKASFAIRVTEPWNTLPTELRNADDSKAFQRMRKRYNK